MIRALLGLLISSLVTPVTRADDIAIFYALDADLKAFVRDADFSAKPDNVGGRTVHRLIFGRHRLLAIKMGSGCVETAVSAGSLLAKYRCRIAFSIGPMGALELQLVPGTWTEVVGIVAYQRGTADSSETVGVSGAGGASLAEAGPFEAIRRVTVASGETFVQSQAERDNLAARSKAEGVEMNAYGLQVACTRFGTRLRIWRVVSDRADEQAGSDFRKFVSNYDGAGAIALGRWVRQLPVNDPSMNDLPAVKKLTDSYLAPRVGEAPGKK